MGEVIDIGFDYSTIDPDGRDDVKEAAVRIRLRMSRTVEDIIEIGRDLIAVKKSLPHGQFERWIEAEFGMAVRTAQRFIQAADRFGAKSDTVSLLPVSVLYELAAPSTDDVIVEEVVSRVSNGEKVTKEDVATLKAEWASERKDLKRQIDDAKHKAKDAQATGIDYGQQIEGLRRELGALRGERDTLRHELDSFRGGVSGQVKTVIPIDDYDAKEKQIAALMSAWNKASAEAREEFLARIDTPVFDRKAGAA
jgi:hypothetical protein